MSKRPPDDEDPIFESIFEQVKNAFSESDSTPLGGEKDDVLDGIRDSLRNLLQETRPKVEPRVTVVEGGRSKNTPPTEKERPNLFVAESMDDIEQASPKVSVRLLKSEDLFEVPPNRPKTMQTAGAIVLAQFEDKQLLFQGRTARHYRIHVYEGQLSLHADKALVAIMNTGQSVDVEAERIEVVAVSPEQVYGEFIHLRTP